MRLAMKRSRSGLIVRSSVETLAGKITQAASRAKPSYYARLCGTVLAPRTTPLPWIPVDRRQNRAGTPLRSGDVRRRGIRVVLRAARSASSSFSVTSFFTSVPVRDESGRLCEVRFYKSNEGRHPLAVIEIADDGAVLPMRWLV